MARTPETRERGLYKNGSRWWLRVRSPSTGVVKPRSTGTDDLRLANRVAQMVAQMRENRPTWDLLDAAASGEIELATLYDHHAAGTLHVLRATRAAEAASVAVDDDPDVEPWVAKWDDHLGFLVGNGKITQATRETYVRQVRALLPAGVVFPRSRFTEDALKAALAALRDPRTGELVTSSTRRRYVAAWQLFHKFARRRVPLVVNPFEYAEEWVPENASARSVTWTPAQVRDVLGRLDGEARAAMTLVFGTGIELAALVAARRADIDFDARTMIARGTKNEHREERTVLIDRWALATVREFAADKLPAAPMFTETHNAIRKQFYEAQVAAGLVAKPPRSKSGKPLWRRVNPHTIHDARHTYAVCRILGLDGEPRQSLKYVAHQLGHADEQMVTRIYSKLGGEQRLAMIQLAEAQQAAANAAKEA